VAITDTVTLLQVMREVARDVAGEVPTGTASAGTVQLITDTTADSPIQSSTIGDDYFRSRWVYISSGTNNGQERRIGSSNATNGTLTPERAYGSSVDDTSVYEIYPFSRTILRQAVRDALERCMHEDWLLVTDLEDGDFRASGVANRTSSNATPTKITTEANLYMGNQALRVANSSANGYSRLTTHHPVRQNVGYRIEAIGRETVGTADLIVWDATGDAEIDSLSTAGTSPDPGTDFFRLSFHFTPPDGCNAISVRLAGVESSADVAWSFVSLTRNAAREFVLSTAIEDPRWVAAPYWRLGGTRSGQVQRVKWFQVERTRGPGTALTLRVDAGPRDGTLWCRLERPYALLDTDSNTTACPAEWLHAGAVVELLTPIETQNATYGAKLARAQARFKRQSRLHQAHVPRFDQLQEPF
jgi:hypothetical protein